MLPIKKPKAIFAWSGGKDSSFCLHQVQQNNEFEVAYLLTTLSADFKRVSMHGVKEELLDLQAESIGIPQLKVWLHETSYEYYEKQMEEVLVKAKSQGIQHVIFGDIFLEDLRAYRENNLKKIEMTAVFPLWKRNTRELINDFIQQGFKTITCCVNDAYFCEEWVGKEINQEFLDTLPSDVDPCGENGEYHSYCYAGPIFKKEIKIKIDEKIYRPLDEKYLKINTRDKKQTKGFWYCEINSADN